MRKNAEMWCGCLAGTLAIEEYKAILHKCGFSGVSVEIVRVYTKDIIRSEFLSGANSDASEGDFETLDGAFAGALISADKWAGTAEVVFLLDTGDAIITSIENLLVISCYFSIDIIHSTNKKIENL